jgi:hypothetical protein
MRDLLLKLLLEHGDREFEWPHWHQDEYFSMIRAGYLGLGELEKYNITPQGLEYLKNA